MLKKASRATTATAQLRVQNLLEKEYSNVVRRFVRRPHSVRDVDVETG